MSVFLHPSKHRVVPTFFMFCEGGGSESVCKRSGLGAGGLRSRTRPRRASPGASAGKGAPLPNPHGGGRAAWGDGERRLTVGLIGVLLIMCARKFFPMFISHLCFLFCELPLHVLYTNGNSLLPLVLSYLIALLLSSLVEFIFGILDLL